MIATNNYSFKVSPRQNTSRKSPNKAIFFHKMDQPSFHRKENRLTHTQNCQRSIQIFRSRRGQPTQMVPVSESLNIRRQVKINH